jgi:hypothetical protein
MVTNNQESQYLLQLETTSKQVASTSSTNRRYQSTSNSSSNKNGMNGTGTHHRPYSEDNDDNDDEVESEQDPNTWILRQQQLQQQQQQQQQQQHDHPYNAAYEILEKANLLERSFLKESFSDIFQEGDLDPNSTLADNFTKKWQWGVYWTPGCGWMLYVSE